MYTKKIYFSGGNVNELQEIFRDVPGVVSVLVGTVSAKNVRSYVEPDFREIADVSAVEIEFNPKKMDLSMLMDVLCAFLNPYAENNAGIYYATGEDEPQVEFHLNFIANRGREPAVSGAKLTINDPNSNPKRSRKCFLRIGRLKNFIAAPENEQNLLQKHPELSADINLTKLKTSLRF